jgi:hypothetical protein
VAGIRHRRERLDVEDHAMRRETSRRSEPAAGPAPVACVACGSDAFAVGAAAEVGRTAMDVDLRCGACGRWQRHRLTLIVADRFLDHMALTQATIARALVAAS